MSQHNFNILHYLPHYTSDDFYEKTIVVVNKARSFVASTADCMDDVGNKLGDYLKDCDNDNNNNDVEKLVYSEKSWVIPRGERRISQML